MIFLDINECLLSIDNCDLNSNCTNTIGSFFCTCNTGYTGNGATCTGDLATWFNHNNLKRLYFVEFNYKQIYFAWRQKWHQNYEKIIGIIFSFTDIDECSLSIDNCDLNSNCTNTNGSFFCTCNSGFSGNGTTCTGNLTAYVIITIYKKSIFRKIQ